ncbi:MAG: GTP-binding protein, partial [Bacteroidia bacterium]|nr:GTP-binding protein [Bacteroidia bacterium]
MKRYTTAQIRNVALIGGTNTGKTLLAEAMLLEGKVIDRKGTIEAGTTVSDYNEIEQQNKKSVYSTVMYTEFMDHKLNIFDTPGSDDFIGAVITSLSVADIAVMVLNAQQGVDVGTEIFSRWVKRLDRPMLFALNQLDHEKANYDQTLETLHQSFGNKVVTVQYPVNPGANFDTFIDVLLMKMYRFKGTNGEREELEIPADQLEKAKELNAKLTEAAAENDEGLMELFFEKGMLTEDEIRAGLAKGIATQGVYPVFCLSGLKNIGVKRLMEFIIKVGPSPADSPMLN